MTGITLESSSPEETRSLGERVGPLLQRCDVLLLSGELGAGKTMFVQGLARGLGFDGPVSSKSFVLLGEYEGRLKLYHADLYRLEDPEYVHDLALDEISAAGVLVVEWPERAEYALPEDALLLRFHITAESTRSIHPEPHGPRARELLDAFSHVAAGGG